MPTRQWLIWSTAIAIAVAFAVWQSLDVGPGWLKSVITAALIPLGILLSILANLLTDRLKKRGKHPHRATRTVLDELVDSEDRARDLQRDLTSALEQAHRSIAAATQINGDRIGTHCWIAFPPPNGTTLERVARHRPGSAPPTPGQKWRPGEGVVGWCWQTRHWEVEDLRAFDDQTLDLPTFADLPEETRKQRTFEQFLASVRKFSIIVAVPVVDGFDQRGVVSLNFGREIDLPIDLFRSDDVVNPLEDAARRCAESLRLAGALDRY